MESGPFNRHFHAHDCSSVPQTRIRIQKGGHTQIAHHPGCRIEVQTAIESGLVVVHQHRNAVGVHTGQIRVHHHIGAHAGLRLAHTPCQQQGVNLLTDRFGTGADPWLFLRFHARRSKCCSGDELILCDWSGLTQSVLRVFASSDQTTIPQVTSLQLSSQASNPDKHTGCLKLIYLRTHPTGLTRKLPRRQIAGTKLCGRSGKILQHDLTIPTHPETEHQSL